ncbi:efflux RND transporter periplasmic adaptor subunit [Cupriavidus basilensis]|uniref:Efflux RND transporter periplasmic adaptor subunit n=1 Tax=Cupriavidus basilensis TaxID=68895 RepID=A0ABT6B145_9BURK|nr:efflux RND transporter periplasmic adaptor subunit [Cupriavidus basilensis]MDF3838609.1 efflux RND transporter periplasmic adaptor subunit [Cupriavidus basilensis]
MTLPASNASQAGATADTVAAPALPARRLRASLLVLALLGALLAAGIVPRLHANATLASRSADAAVTTVATVQPGNAAAIRELILPADVRAFQDAPVYARVNGYLRRWYADIGTPVKAGQLLAEIDAPEVSDQLRQARADEAIAAANYALAKSTAARWQDLLDSRSVAQQDTDQKVADMQAKAATLASARSNTARLAQLASYTQIRAPFDGVVTARNVDTGALIDAGSAGGPGRELFHLSAGERLRVYVQVPQDASGMVGPQMQAWLTLPQFPGQRFAATVARNAGAIDNVTRSLRVELDVANAGGRILPGAYAEAHLSAPQASPGLDLPANTLMFQPQGTCVAVVGADGKLAIRPVTIGRDFGSHVEITEGLHGGEQVVVNPGDGLLAGDSVRVVPVAPVVPVAQAAPAAAPQATALGQAK